jgi:UDP-2-acetamido-2,6-beta-L-arabino-hexul-4-ose reductase
MMPSPPTILVTGADGFIGRNLLAHLRQHEGVRLLTCDLTTTEAELDRCASQSDVIFHLAGVNRPENVKEFELGNAGLTASLCRMISEAGRKPRIIFSSSIQAELDNPYGRSKRRAEDVLQQFARRTGTPLAIFRLKNVFGKWCRPNYNSVVATFCHNIAHDLPIQVSDADRELELLHIDDVVAAFLSQMDRPQHYTDGLVTPDPIPSYTLTLGDLAKRIRSFREMRQSLHTPDFSVRFNQQLYATYLSYLDPSCLEYGLDVKCDARGSLAELVKAAGFGQIFVSRTRPGVTRGNHYHHVKAEKFLVLAGEGLIRLRRIENAEVHEFRVSGADYRVVDIPPGYTHSITNVGVREMVTLFWTDEVFDPAQPDTVVLPVELRAAA